MTINDTINKNIAEARKLLTKYDPHLSRSGDYSALLRTLPGASSRYEELQHSEVVLHLARQTWDERFAAVQASRSGVDAVRRLLVIVARAAVNIAEAEGKPGLRDFLVVDANDEASLARRLAEEVKDVRFVGDGFSQAFITLREELIAHQAAHQVSAQAFDTATRDFGQAFYKASAVLAESKALLFANGVKVTDRKPAKKKKVAVKEPTPAVSPVPIAA